MCTGFGLRRPSNPTKLTRPCLDFAATTVSSETEQTSRTSPPVRLSVHGQRHREARSRDVTSASGVTSTSRNINDIFCDWVNSLGQSEMQYPNGSKKRYAVGFEMMPTLWLGGANGNRCPSVVKVETRLVKRLQVQTQSNARDTVI